MGEGDKRKGIKLCEANTNAGYLHLKPIHTHAHSRFERMRVGMGLNLEELVHKLTLTDQRGFPQEIKKSTQNKTECSHVLNLNYGKLCSGDALH